jgi:hypothetical protein
LALAPRLAWRFTRATITKQARPATAPEERPGGWKPTSYVDKMINAIIAGSWSSTWFGIRAPWMVERRFLPAHGTATALWQYLETYVATPMGSGRRAVKALHLHGLVQARRRNHGGRAFRLPAHGPEALC